MRSDLADRPDRPHEAAAAGGIEIAEFTAARSADALLVKNESFRDHWGSTESSPESWAHNTGSSAFRPALSFLAYGAGQPLGVLLSFEFDAETIATGRRDLYIQTVGTRRAGRGRGIATALLGRALRAAAAGGFGTASLEVDADSPTGAVRLYERAGFAIRSTSVSMAKALPSL
jgi:ribosomal protein S18 acetylase RimI-like enzyme